MHEKRPHHIGFIVIARDENNAPEVSKSLLRNE